MSQLFLRADELSDIIYDVKLYLPEWKVLFATDGEMDSEQLSDFLELEQETVDKALHKLQELRLIKKVTYEGMSEEDQIRSEEIDTEMDDLFGTEISEQEIEELTEERTDPKVFDEQEDEKLKDDFNLPKESIIEEEETAEFELPLDDFEEQVKTDDEIFKLSKTDEISEQLKDKLDLKASDKQIKESQEDLDDLINDLLEEEEEEAKIEGEVESPLDTIEKTEDKSKATSISDEMDVSEKEEEFDLGDIFETDLEETEQSLDEMFDGMESEVDEVDLAEGIAEVLPPKAKEIQKTILVVDDSVVIRKMVEIALENENYNIVSVANGKDALAFLDEKEPNMVILDIMLPDVNGLDILKAIRASKDIPVVMLSAKDTPRETSKAKELGANDFIPKPFKDEELISKIHELIGE